MYHSHNTWGYRLLPLLPSEMAEASISDLRVEPPESNIKRQKFIKYVLTGNSKQYLGKAYTEEQVNKLSAEEVNKLLSNYEVKLLGQMVKSLGISVIKMYLMGACATLGKSNQDALRGNLESDPFLNSALQRFTCELYYRFGSFLTPLSVGLITNRQYLSERGTKNVGTNGDNDSE